MYTGAPTVKQMSQIMIEILDLKHPLKIESPLKSLQQSRKRKSKDIDMQPKPGCIRGTLGDCKGMQQIICYSKTQACMAAIV